MRIILPLCIIWQSIFYGQGVSMADLNFPWKSGDVTKLMTLLMKYGEHELQNLNDKIKAKGKEISIRQYLVTLVVSENELKTSKTWNALPETITKDNARVKVTVNTKDYKNFQYRTKKPLHGEILMLYEHEDLRYMLERLRQEKKEDVHPFVVLYSHYIPCSSVRHVEYNCAEELANAAVVNRNLYKMLVGFKEIFNGTSFQKSRDFMNSAGIKQFQFENNVFKPLESEVSQTLAQPVRIFQSLFYMCLYNSPVSDQCCTVDTSKPDYPHTLEKILSMYVNTAVYQCTTSTLKTFVGDLTTLSRRSLRICIDDYVTTNTQNACQICVRRNTLQTIRSCVLMASTFSTAIGRPENPNYPYSPEWKIGSPKWDSLYVGYNVNAKSTLPGLYCWKKTNTLESLCTSMEVPKPEWKNIPQRVRTSFQDLKKIGLDKLSRGL